MKLRGNYFGPDYLDCDVRDGVLHNPAGTRIIALSEDFLLGFRKALIEETGQAHHVVFETCGRTWGENMAKRLEKELSEYYDCPLHEMPMSSFSLLLKECFLRHGWGKLEIDWELGFKQGIFEVHIVNPAFSGIFNNTENEKGLFDDDVFTGLLAAFFSRFSSKELKAYQIGYQAAPDSPRSIFVIGMDQRLKKVPDMVRSGKSSDVILNELRSAA